MSPQDLDAHTVIMKVALGWSLLTTIILILIAILLDIFGVRRLDKHFRIWVYGTFLIGLMSGMGAWFANLIKLDVSKAAEAVSTGALDQAANRAYTPTQAPKPPKVDSKSVNRSDYKVFIQFAGVIRREDVITLSNKLSEAGWKVQGRERGGERTSAASGYNEVRFSGNSELAAKLLATEVQSENLSSNQMVVVNNNSILANTLEVWVSR